MKAGNFWKHGDKLLFVLALAVLVTALFSQSWGKTIREAVAPSMVFVQWWQDDNEKKALGKLIQEFENLHTGIKVVLKTMPYEDVRSELFDPGETPPGDIFALDPLWVPELIKKGTIENSAQETGAPLLSFIDVLYYNVEILKKAGFTHPPKTRSEFLTYVRALTPKQENSSSPAPDKIRAIAMDLNGSRGIYDDVYPWIWSAGTQLIKDGKPVINSRPVIESLSFLASLNSEGFIASNPSSGGGGNKLDDFIAGRAAFMIAPVKDIKPVKERMGDGAFGISSIPIPDNYTGNSFYGSAGWTAGVYSASTHKEEANLFTAFLAEKAPLLSEVTNAIPANDAPAAAADPLYSKAWDIAIAGESINDFSGLSGENNLEAIFREELSALFAGKSTADYTAAAIQKRWEQSLNLP